MQHSKYWSCTPLADWIRGTDKLHAGTSKEWHTWKKEAKAAHPFRFWSAEKALGKVQDILGWPNEQLNNISYYINNRWVTKTNALTAHPKDIKPGTWMDVGSRFLPCLFNELVDFVEVETAGHHVAWSDKKDKYNPPQFGVRFSMRTWRCPEAGIDHLTWSASLVYDEDMGVNPDDKLYGKPTSQAEGAKKILELYYWWKNVYPNRPDPHEASGWSALCMRRAETHADDGWLFEDNTPAERKESRLTLKKTTEIEKQYWEEDTRMMIELIKLRGTLWT